MLRPSTRRAAVAVACAALAIVHTWPLASGPGTLSLNGHADVLLNEWILAWVAHQLPRAPLQLFEANIFHPARHALAFSEPLIAPAVLGAPLAWMGGSPVLVHNLLLLGGFALTALAGYAVVFSWTRDRAAGLVAGSALAFNSHTLARIAHLQAVHLYGLALAVLFADALVLRPRRREAVGLALSMVLLAYTSVYLAVFAAFAVAVVVATRALEWRAHAGAFATNLAIAAAIAAAATLPLFLPYWWVSQEYALARTLEHVAQFSATPAGYLASPARLHEPWSGRFTADPGVNAFFAGCTVIALACTAFLLSRPPLRGRVAMLAALAVTGAVLSLGTATPVYGWLYDVFPPLHGLRVASRFGNLYLLAMAFLAGIGLALVRRRLASRRLSLLLGAAAVAAVNVEAAILPIAYQRFEGIPRIYSVLAHEPEPVVLVEIPIAPPAVVFENAPYVLASTAHWQKLVNGYSGFIPPDYRRLQPRFWHFPHPQSLAAMREAGVTHVMVHPQRLFAGAEELVQEAERTPALERVAIGPRGMRLYRLR